MDLNFKKEPEPVQSPTAASNVDEQAVRSDLKPEVVESVPVKLPDSPVDAGGSSLANPIQALPDQAPNSEVDMDRILEDVNQKVKTAAAEVKPKKSWLPHFGRKPASPQMNTVADTVAPPKPRRMLPLVVAGLAVLVGAGLSVAAYLAFAGGSAKPSTAVPTTRDPESANTSVIPEDIDDLSSDLQSEIDSLKSSEDFDSAALSDSSLGL